MSVPLTLSEVQERLLSMLREIVRVLDAGHIPYMLSFGTLLGAVRHKGMIPWDDDVDIHVLVEDVADVVSLLNQGLPQSLRAYTAADRTMPWDIDARVVDSSTVIREDNGHELSALGDGYEGLYVDLFETPRMKRSGRLLYSATKYARAAYVRARDVGGNVLSVGVSQMLVRLCRGLFILSQTLPGRRMLLVSDRWSGGLYREEDVLPLESASFAGMNLQIPANHDDILRDLYGNYMEVPSESNRPKHFVACYGAGTNRGKAT